MIDHIHMYLYIYGYLSIYIYLSVCLSIHLSVRLSVCMYVCLSMDMDAMLIGHTRSVLVDSCIMCALRSGVGKLSQCLEKSG